MAIHLQLLRVSPPCLCIFPSYFQTKLSFLFSVGTLANQTLDGEPSAAALTGVDASTNYSLSYLPGQRLSRCTCSNDTTHPGPKNSDGTWKGRSAPEVSCCFVRLSVIDLTVLFHLQIDVFEAQTDSTTLVGQVSQSAQWAPYNPVRSRPKGNPPRRLLTDTIVLQYYIWENATYGVIVNSSITELNSYRGGGQCFVSLYLNFHRHPPVDLDLLFVLTVYQETSSGVSTTNHDCYQYDTNDDAGCYSVYAFE